MSKNIGLYKIRRYKVLESGRKEETYPTIQGKMSCKFKFWADYILKERQMCPRLSFTELFTKKSMNKRFDVVYRAVTKFVSGTILDRELIAIDGNELKGKGEYEEIGI